MPSNAAPTTGSRAQLFLVTLTVNSVDYGIWDKWDWSGKDTDSTKYRSGGSPNEESLGGPNTFGDLMLSRNYRIERDAGVCGPLFEACGILTATATKQPLDRSYNAVGKATICAGMVKTFVDPVADSTSTDAAMLELTIEVNSVIVK